MAIGGGRFLAAPAVLGQLLTQMKPQAGQRALVVGAGTGYSAAVLAAMGLSVTALEVDPELIAIAGQEGVSVIEGPLAAGHAPDAPYGQILIDGAIEQIPQALIDQLEEGGRLGTAILDRGITRLVVGRNAGRRFGIFPSATRGCRYLPGFSRPKVFTF